MSWGPSGAATCSPFTLHSAFLGPGRGEPSLSLWLAWEKAVGSWKNSPWGTGPRGSGWREGQACLGCAESTCLLCPRRGAAEDLAGPRQTVWLGPLVACWPSVGSNLLDDAPARRWAAAPHGLPLPAGGRPGCFGWVLSRALPLYRAGYRALLPRGVAHPTFAG